MQPSPFVVRHPRKNDARRLLAALLPAVLALCAAAGPAAALDVTRRREIAAPAAAVWAVIGGFCDIARWHPQVERCTVSSGGEGPVRAIVAAEGLGTIVERETDRDEAAMRYDYAYLSGSLPVRSYASTLSVRPAGTGSVVTWTAHFEASGMSEAEALADIEGVYERGLEGIARQVER